MGPHDLRDCHNRRRAKVTTQLILYLRTKSWPTSIIRGDKNWCLYVNIKCSWRWGDKGKRPDSQAEAAPTRWWLWFAFGGLERRHSLRPLRRHPPTLTADLYCQQLDRLELKLKKSVRFTFRSDSCTKRSLTLSKSKSGSPEAARVWMVSAALPHRTAHTWCQQTTTLFLFPDDLQRHGR